MYICEEKLTKIIDMKFAIDTSSKKKHYVEKDNFYIVENDELLTIQTAIDGNTSKSKDIFDLFCYFLNLNPGDKRAYRVLLNYSGVYINRTGLCDKCLEIYGGNVRGYYANFRHLSILGIMTKKDGFYCVTDKYNLNNYKNVKLIAFKLKD